MGPSRARSRFTDPFLKLGINPRNEVLNLKLLTPCVNSMGKIMGRNKTGLGWKSQRQVGKAIRRARSMGVMPYFTSDPEAAAASTSYNRRGRSRYPTPLG